MKNKRFVQENKQTTLKLKMESFHWSQTILR